MSYLRMETWKGHFDLVVQGDLCEDCGFVCEAFPDMPAKSISDAYRTNDSFRDRFKGCLRVLHGVRPIAIGENRP